ncbi:MAG: DUF4296 domain-containing protein [Flavobacteriaceae bacterium]|nr:DUF4296 domain-containing protein [Flavobacteriaceae bacterium]
MKKIVFLFLLFAILISCQKPAVSKPYNLIDEEVMVDIMYDISVLEAMKSQKVLVLEVNKINPNTYIYKKYKIDSLLFSNSNKFYASDIKKYKEIFDKVNKRIEEKIESFKKANTSKLSPNDN